MAAHPRNTAIINFAQRRRMEAALMKNMKGSLYE
jgi:hypothetical protein